MKTLYCLFILTFYAAINCNAQGDPFLKNLKLNTDKLIGWAENNELNKNVAEGIAIFYEIETEVDKLIITNDIADRKNTILYEQASAAHNLALGLKKSEADATLIEKYYLLAYKKTKSLGTVGKYKTNGLIYSYIDIETNINSLIFNCANYLLDRAFEQKNFTDCLKYSNDIINTSSESGAFRINQFNNRASLNATLGNWKNAIADYTTCLTLYSNLANNQKAKLTKQTIELIFNIINLQKVYGYNNAEKNIMKAIDDINSNDEKVTCLKNIITAALPSINEKLDNNKLLAANRLMPFYNKILSLNYTDSKFIEDALEFTNKFEADLSVDYDEDEFSELKFKLIKIYFANNINNCNNVISLTTIINNYKNSDLSVNYTKEINDMLAQISNTDKNCAIKKENERKETAKRNYESCMSSRNYQLKNAKKMKDIYIGIYPTNFSKTATNNIAPYSGNLIIFGKKTGHEFNYTGVILSRSYLYNFKVPDDADGENIKPLWNGYSANYNRRKYSGKDGQSGGVFKSIGIGYTNRNTEPVTTEVKNNTTNITTNQIVTSTIKTIALNFGIGATGVKRTLGYDLAVTIAPTYNTITSPNPKYGDKNFDFKNRLFMYEPTYFGLAIKVRLSIGLGFNFSAGSKVPKCKK